ncbi:TPA: hypothetical protein I8271_002243 [Kluyvera intermedia]|uniref:Uncharacterized protein n=2 Tax=Enterobacteriaceae TaxID=543 RepID=A0AAC8TMH4_9ENTR|nr:hypothetical protein [Phytobacter ursingii]HAT2207630.1 hypothetical protein [Kluyvera intermedia]AKL12559.1 hypothetical protein AB182_15185 [Phytobacter ursingii]HAT2518316.1 hypothetical protein [Kluyvera intermedia]HAT2606358.1 hypothetical protein [Kluyvera intermedia]HAT2682097.1 hypothetical protein [Kluyvera intermedia]
MTVALKKDLNKPTVYFSMIFIAFEKVFIWQAAKHGGRITQLTVALIFTTSNDVLISVNFPLYQGQGLKMKRILALFAMIILLLVGVYALVDIFSSLWLVLKYESLNAYSTGVLAGKVIFLLVVSGLCLIVRRIYKNKINR